MNWIFSYLDLILYWFVCSVVALLRQSSHSAPFSSSFFLSIIIFISSFIFHHAIKRFFDSMCMVLFYIKFRSSVFYMFFALAPSCLSRAVQYTVTSTMSESKKDCFVQYYRWNHQCCISSGRKQNETKHKTKAIANTLTLREKNI